MHFLMGAADGAPATVAVAVVGAGQVAGQAPMVQAPQQQFSLGRHCGLGRKANLLTHLSLHFLTPAELCTCSRT